MQTYMRCPVGVTDWLKVGVGLHRGSVLSSFLFAVVMNRLTVDVGQEFLQMTDRQVTCGESRDADGSEP